MTLITSGYNPYLGKHCFRLGLEVMLMVAIHLDDFISNLKEVDRLADIHAAVTKPGPGRKHHVEVLHKSAIVLLVACWEAFVEDLAKNSLAAVIAVATDPLVIPTEVRDRIASKLQGQKAWQLAGDGWKTACKNHLKEVLERTIGMLNTPKTAQVNELFEKVLGHKNLSSDWKWRGRSVQAAQAALDALVTLRGSIAHRVKTAQSVKKSDVAEAQVLLLRLAGRSDNAINSAVNSLVADKPWDYFSYDELLELFESK
jgi:hypothetical protein